MKPIFFLILLSSPILLNTSEDCARCYLTYLNEKLRLTKGARELSKWNFLTNVSDASLQAYTNLEVEIFDVDKSDHKKLMKYPWHEFKDANILRQYKFFKDLKMKILSKEKIKELKVLVNTMEKRYAETMVPDFHNSSHLLSVEELQIRMVTSNNPAELSHIWIEWRSVLGREIKKLFPKFAELLKESANLNGYESVADHHLANYEQCDIVNKARQVWLKIQPLYLQLHAYVRYRLRDFFEALISDYQPIPVHLTGDVNGESWRWLSEITVPYGNDEYENFYPDIWKHIPKRRIEIYKMADDFYTSLNFSRLPKKVWELSRFKKCESNQCEMCTPRIFKFLQEEKIRILDCESYEDLTSLDVALQIVGNVHKYLTCEDQPFIFQKSRLNTLSFILGGLTSLSAHTYTYLKTVTDVKTCFTPQDMFNNLFYNALKMIPPLPNCIALSLWRMGVFKSTIPPEHYNSEWWKLMHSLQGIEPPVDRSESDFDVSSVMKLILSKPVLDKFLGTVISFQLHREFCLRTGLYERNNPKKPLHECCLFGKPEVGNLLIEGMKPGRSKSWDYILEPVFGPKAAFDADALLEYYEPLMKWLQEENKKNGEKIGWGKPSRSCKTTEDGISYEEETQTIRESLSKLTVSK